MLENPDKFSTNFINSLASDIYENNVEKGFWDNPREIGTLLMLVVSELSEALEGDRKDLMDDHLPNRKMLEVELADAVIRILDIGAGYNMDIGGAIMEKIEYNKDRPRMHGGKKY